MGDCGCGFGVDWGNGEWGKGGDGRAFLNREFFEEERKEFRILTIVLDRNLRALLFCAPFAFDGFCGGPFPWSKPASGWDARPFVLSGRSQAGIVRSTRTRLDRRRLKNLRVGFESRHTAPKSRHL